MDSLTAKRVTTTGRSAPREFAVVAMLLLATGVVLCKDIAVGGLRHGDSAVHAMDGVLIHDWAAAGFDAWPGPMEFATRQYSHYPTLGIGRHYPPGFALVESVFFAVLGISAYSARLCVVFFGMIAALGTYVFTRSFTDRPTSALGVMALLAMPATTLWGRQTLLEIPTLAVLIWAGVAFSWYMRQPSPRRLALLLTICALTVLFKQTAVFLMGAVALTLLVGAVWFTIRMSHCLWAITAAAVAIVVVVVSLDGHGAQLLRGDLTLPNRWSWEALTFYLFSLPDQVGAAVLIAALTGILISRGMPGLHVLFLALWIAACYMMLTIADYKNPRYLYLGLFPIVVWAALGVGRLLALLPGSRMRCAGLALACTGCCVIALAAPVEYRADYGHVVVANRDKIIGRAVLFSGLRDGDFVFAVRQHIPWRQAMIIRGSKLLYTCNGRPELDFVSNVTSADALAEIMRNLAFEYVFVERDGKLGLMEDRMLREYLADSGIYRRLSTHRFQMGENPSYRDTTLDVYEAAGPLSRNVTHFDILIPRTKRTIRVDLSRWL